MKEGLGENRRRGRGVPCMPIFQGWSLFVKFRACSCSISFLDELRKGALIFSQALKRLCFLRRREQEHVSYFPDSY
jgi:hypothetical protein